MGKKLYIAEKPSVAQEFARVLKISGKRQDGYLESEDAVVTWCVGHLVTMSYPDAYDPALKRWDMATLPFIPGTWKYEVIDGVKKQFRTVSALLNRKDVDVIYVCTDSGREGEYIYRLVAQEAHVKDKETRRVWIDSQTEEEILRGIREAKDISAYDALADSAYLRAKEDYLMGINFSRVLTLKFGDTVSRAVSESGRGGKGAAGAGPKRSVISVGRVMTCVLGMVVRREREIRAFVPSKFYRVVGTFSREGRGLEAEWKAVKGSKYFESPLLYKDNGFRRREDAERLVRELGQDPPMQAEVRSIERKTEKKGAPLLFNLAELQNECAKRFKISPDETLNIVQELYEKKLVTYPRTDARVLSSAVAKEIGKNLSGLAKVEAVKPFAEEVLAGTRYRTVGKSMYTDDSKITDHYAIIPTGQGLSALGSLKGLGYPVYELIARRFLAIFYPPAQYEKVSAEFVRKDEHFFAGVRILKDPGYLKVLGKDPSDGGAKAARGPKDAGQEAQVPDEEAEAFLKALRKGDRVDVSSLKIREGETTPPKRYTSGSLILAMENAGHLIEDEELRAQIKGSGIGTSATRAEILKKLKTIDYIKINGKSQAVTPSLQGELVYDVVDASMTQLLNPELTASWEKGLSMVADGQIGPDEYMEKLSAFVVKRTDRVKGIGHPEGIRARFRETEKFYRQGAAKD